MTAIQNDINLEHIEADYGRRIMQEFHTTLYPAEGVQYRGKERNSDPPPAPGCRFRGLVVAGYPRQWSIPAPDSSSSRLLPYMVTRLRCDAVPLASLIRRL